mgnify:CR=1 FL=1
MREDQKQYFLQLGLTVAYYRKTRKLTQEKLAEKVGISRNHMSRIETADCAASLDVIFDIAKALEITPDKLFRSIE